MEKKDFYSIPEAAEICAVGRTTMWRWVKSDKLKAFVGPGGQYRILKDELKSFVSKNGIYSKTGIHLSKEKILIVDDDTDVLKVLFHILSKNGYQVETALDGFEAGIKVIEFKPGLILLDLIMPGMDGFEVCRRIKANPDTSNIKVLIMTGFDIKKNRERIMRAGADGYLSKPIGKDVLLEKVKDLLSMPLGCS